MPETCENWPSLVNSGIYFAHQTRDIYQVLPYSVDFKAALSQAILSKSSFIRNKGRVNIWNDRKTQK